MLLVFGLVCPETGSHEGDFHWTTMQKTLSKPPLALDSEILIVGDGDRMRFWPLWPFYRYLNASMPTLRRTSAHFETFASGVKLVTPASPGFRSGMAVWDAIATFCETTTPLIYFLVSPGDQPLLLNGVRDYSGPKALEVEDMEGGARLSGLIRNSGVDFVFFRYFCPELQVLEEECPGVSFHYLPFFLDPSHFHLPKPPASNADRDIDVLVYGNTWSHRYPLRHRVLRALTTRSHSIKYKILPHPGYDVSGSKILDATERLCSLTSDAFWQAAVPSGLRPPCCIQNQCNANDCEEAAMAVAQGQLSSCDDIQTCGSGDIPCCHSRELATSVTDRVHGDNRGTAQVSAG
eukprot:2707994-Rhodomonas_salina.1